ncbi:THAP domain-containing protein 1 [Trichomycterus rosablanca]|uniref:THAP domain-containing protein 1 n=1 Tax=Trichomycterus rosablanca TaxID=2290929 RepID=UPI002F35CF4A
MVQSCSAYGCKNRYHKDKNVSFHKFPLARPDICGKWVAAIKRSNFKPTKYSNICSQHFTKDCFKLECNNRVLKENAVPSLFSFDSSKIKAEPLEEALTPETDFNPTLPSVHTPEEPEVALQPQNPEPSTPVSTSSPAQSPPAAVRDEDRELRLGAFVSCDHNYTVEDSVQQKKRVEQLEEKLRKLRRKLKTLRQKCRRQERQLQRYRSTEELYKCGQSLELGKSYVVLPSGLLTTLKERHTATGL